MGNCTLIISECVFALWFIQGGVEKHQVGIQDLASQQLGGATVCRQIPDAKTPHAVQKKAAVPLSLPQEGQGRLASGVVSSPEERLLPDAKHARG